MIRPDLLADYVDKIFAYPGMFGSTPDELQVALWVALHMWEIAAAGTMLTRSDSVVSATWDNVLKQCAEDVGQQVTSTTQFSTLTGSVDELAKFIRPVWDKVRSPIHRLAHVAREDDA